MQVELGSADGTALTLQSLLGAHQAGLRIKMKCFPMTKEIRGSMWHSWSWLHDRGLPINVEVTNKFFCFLTLYWFSDFFNNIFCQRIFFCLCFTTYMLFLRVVTKTNTSHGIFFLFSQGLCSIQGVFPQLQSRAQLTVDRHKLLTSGLNVSMADGRLAVQLSYSPLASSQTVALHSLDTALTAQFKGQTVLTA